MTKEGTYIRYEAKDFNNDHMAIIRRANIILDEYRDKGFTMTLRQLYYQFVARGFGLLLDSKHEVENSDRNYTRLGNIISDARIAGLVSWTAIEDRTRHLRGMNFVESPKEAVAEAREGYALDLWHNQPYRPEVWVEKEALVGVIEDICMNLRVNFFACKGYNSQSEQWRAGQRFRNYVLNGQRPIIFHLGDHDPSGIDMTRDNRDRLSMFAGVPINVVRLALNMDQVHKFNPPPNPAKVSDSRFEQYMREYGETSWELDALPPDVLASLISSNVSKVRNEKLWNEALAEEAEDKDKLDEIIEGL